MINSAASADGEEATDDNPPSLSPRQVAQLRALFDVGPSPVAVGAGSDCSDGVAA